MKALRLLLYFALGLALGTASALSFAGTFTSYQGSAFRNINGTTYWKGDATSFAASKATVMETVKVGGTFIPVPTFGQVTGAALAAVRMTPGFAGAALISWLASQGLELMDGQWKKPDNSTQAPSEYGQCSSAGLSTEAASLMPTGTGQTASDCMNAAMSAINSVTGYWYVKDPQMSCTASSCSFSYQYYSPQDSYTWRSQNISGWSKVTTQCPDGWVLEGTICRSNGYSPAGDSDWDKVLGIQPPAEVMADLCRRLSAMGSGCETTGNGTLKASAPLSDWQTDPNTGERTRDTANWNPKPNASDPFAGEITTTREKETPQIDPKTGQPTGSTNTSETDTTKDQDFCTLHPDSLACSTFGKADEPDKLDQTKQVSITPDTGFGPQDGTCPADLTYTVHLTGTQLRFSYQPVCTGLRTFRPVIIGMAWISGVLIFLGITRKAQG